MPAPGRSDKPDQKHFPATIPASEHIKHVPSRYSIAQLLQQGQAHHQQGQWDKAATCYREVIDRQPRSFDALHLLGLLTLQTGDAANAVSWLQRAAKVNPADAATQSLIGIALQSSGQAEASIAFFDRAVRLQPKNAEYHYNFGKALRSLDRFADAATSYENTIKLNPRHVDAFNNLSEVLINIDREKEALVYAEKAIEINPSHAEAWSNLGGAQLLLNKTLDALVSINKALTLRPNLLHALNNRAKALLKAGHTEEALRCAIHTISIYPDSHEAIFTRGFLFSELSQSNAAIADFDQALSIKPDFAPALVSRGNLRFSENAYDLARLDFELAVFSSPNNCAAHYNLGILLLLTGAFERGWQEYAWRFKTGDLKEHVPALSTPYWDGTTPVSDLLIWGEQGVGDQVMYASMLDDVKKRASNITVAINDKLIPIFTRSFPDFRFISLSAINRTHVKSTQISIGDLGGLLRKQENNFIAGRKSYLKADPKRTSELRKILSPNGNPVCGFSWYSNHKSVGINKSIKLIDLAQILVIESGKYVNLQYGDTSAERADFKARTGTEILQVDSVDTWSDVDGLASLIDACDVIVTISNTTAHLAGALGKRVFLMLPYSAGRFWCWQTARSDALWYPNVRIFRQPKEGDWASVIREVRDALAALPDSNTQQRQPGDNSPG